MKRLSFARLLHWPFLRRQESQKWGFQSTDVLGMAFGDRWFRPIGLVAITACLLVCFYSGCGNKREPAGSEEASSSVPAVLPELSQNQIQSNPSVPEVEEEPVFEPAPDDLQRPADQDQASQESPTD